MQRLAEYIWLDGHTPTPNLRSKTKVVDWELSQGLEALPVWSFDGSSTQQASTEASDLYLQPVCSVKDPTRSGPHILVLCEVLDESGAPHITNTRALLRKVLESGASTMDPLVGFEQEYTLFKGEKALAWTFDTPPQSQGPFYCGNGTDRVYGRELSEAHTQACLDAGLQIFGANAEVMPGQWEVQIGYRGFEEDNSALTAADHLLLARWLLVRLAEKYDLVVSFSNKPVKGDWNGAGCHTNISTKQSRSSQQGLKYLEGYVQALSKEHSRHIRFYGHALDERLTGQHETCSIKEFRSGIGDRSSSIRIPKPVQDKGCGYFEDRRPGANSDPYLVLEKILGSLVTV